MGQKWNLGVLDIDSGVRKTLEEMEEEYATMVSKETPILEGTEMETDDYDMDER